MKLLKILLILVIIQITFAKYNVISENFKKKLFEKFKENNSHQDSSQQSVNDRPIIGVLTQPSEASFPYPQPYSYIASSYVKFVEGAGAQVVPFQYNWDVLTFNKVLSSVNGILIPGGDAEIYEADKKTLTKWGQSIKNIIEYTILQHKNGKYFPIWGTCLGFEAIVTVLAGSDIRVEVDDQNLSEELKLLKTEVSNNVFNTIPKNLQNYITSEKFAYFNHKWGFLPSQFEQNQILKNTFTITSSGKTPNGTVEFVSSIVGNNNLPIFGVQFHPEKNAYEWNSKIKINHSPQAIQTSQLMAEFFVNQARKNFQSFITQEEQDHYLIYNYNSVPLQHTFMSAYFFAQPDQPTENDLNLYPIIGVMTEPSTYPSYPAADYGELASTYVKFLESAGARVVPIIWNWDNQTLTTIFGKINGLLFPGGDTSFFTNTNPDHYTQFLQTIDLLLNLAIDANEKGDYFPVWATCLGFEATVVVIGQDHNNTLLQILDDQNRSENITLVNQTNSVIFQNLPTDLYNYMQTGAPMYFNHDLGVTIDQFYNNPYLNNFFRVTSIAHTINGTAFISSIEGVKYPIFASQFHPEKPPYIWWDWLNINHEPQSISVSQYIGNTFVQLARKNQHQFDSQDEINQYIVWNWCPIMQTSGSYMTVYFPPNANYTEVNKTYSLN